MWAMSTGQPIGYLAKRTANARRVLMNTFQGDMGPLIALDLMGLESPTKPQVAFAHVVASSHQETLARAELFLADDDMVDLLDAAASTMPDQHLHDTDIITPDGFVYFSKPLPDRSGVQPLIPIHAMSWAFIAAGHPLLVERGAADSILITSYVSVVESLNARGQHVTAQTMPAGSPKYLPNATVMWTIGTLIGEVFGQEPPSSGFTPGFYQRVMAAFWTLAQQPKMTTTTEAPAGAPVDQRRNKRAGVADPYAPVRVVRLHHRLGNEAQPGTGSEHGDRKVSVRFPVRGFWRRQWYRSVEQHRHIYIEPHWRGPEGGPVSGGERVFLASGTRSPDPGTSD
jgi:hypothetical protein